MQKRIISISSLISLIFFYGLTITKEIEKEPTQYKQNFQKLDFHKNNVVAEGSIKNNLKVILQSDYREYAFKDRVTKFCIYINQLNMMEGRYWRGWTEGDNIYVYKSDDYLTLEENKLKRSTEGKINMSKITNEFGGEFTSIFENFTVGYDGDRELLSLYGKETFEPNCRLEGLSEIFNAKMRIDTGRNNGIKVSKEVARNYDVINTPLLLEVYFTLSCETIGPDQNLTFKPVFRGISAKLVTKDGSIIWSSN